MQQKTNRVALRAKKGMRDNLEKVIENLFVRRHPILLGLEGWYETKDTPNVVAIKELYAEKGRGRITDWAIETGLIDTLSLEERDTLSQKTFSFKLSCRFNDFRRMGETKHFYSCIARANERFAFMCDENYAILYVPDKTGQMLWRCLVYLIEIEGKPSLVAIKDYGNADFARILKELSKKIPVYLGLDCRLGGFRERISIRYGLIGANIPSNIVSLRESNYGEVQRFM